MSRRLISLNPDLQRLADEGYEIEVRSGFLLVHSVPYVNGQREVALGTLVSELTMVAPDVLTRPGTHQIYFIGEHPSHADGRHMVQIANASSNVELAPGLIVNHYFSHKPAAGYENYYDKVKTYERVISDQARVLKPSADAKTFKTIEPIEEKSVFVYEDTSSSRAGIRAIAARLASQRIAIVGLGGTGAYLLDFVAKTHVREIHLYDGGPFRQHNAFRAPGAASREVLDRRQSKVGYLSEVYAAMRSGVVPHEAMITEDNVGELAGYDFVFLCVDKGTVRQLIAAALGATNTTFIDAGMGVNLTEDKQHLWGTCRVTTSTPSNRERARERMPVVDREDELYGSNIQVADLNCMNALLAIFKWKRLSGFYLDDRSDFNLSFSISLNKLTNEEED